MGKKKINYSLAGIFNKNEMKITEVKKDDMKFIYDLNEILKEFDGKDVKITISEEDEIDYDVG